MPVLWHLCVCLSLGFRLRNKFSQQEKFGSPPPKPQCRRFALSPGQHTFHTHCGAPAGSAFANCILSGSSSANICPPLLLLEFANILINYYIKVRHYLELKTFSHRLPLSHIWHLSAISLNESERRGKVGFSLHVFAAFSWSPLMWLGFQLKQLPTAFQCILCLLIV